MNDPVADPQAGLRRWALFGKISLGMGILLVAGVAAIWYLVPYEPGRDGIASDSAEAAPGASGAILADLIEPLRPGETGLPGGGNDAHLVLRVDGDTTVLTPSQRDSLEKVLGRIEDPTEEFLAERGELDPMYFLPNRTFVDTVFEDEGLSPGLLTCKKRLADGLMAWNLAKRVAVWGYAGDAEKDSVLTRAGCLEFSPGREYFGWFPDSADGTAAWRPIELHYSLSADFPGARVMLKLRAGADPHAPQPVLMASGTEALSEAPQPFLAWKPQRLETPKLDSSSQPTNVYFPAGIGENPWFKSIGLQQRCHWQSGDSVLTRPQDGEGVKQWVPGSVSCEVEVRAQTLGGKLVHPGRGEWQESIGLRAGEVTEVVVTDLDGNNEADFILYTGEHGVYQVPIFNGAIDVGSRLAAPVPAWEGD